MQCHNHHHGRQLSVDRVEWWAGSPVNHIWCISQVYMKYTKHVPEIVYAYNIHRSEIFVA